MRTRIQQWPASSKKTPQTTGLTRGGGGGVILKVEGGGDALPTLVQYALSLLVPASLTVVAAQAGSGGGGAGDGAQRVAAGDSMEAVSVPQPRAPPNFGSELVFYLVYAPDNRKVYDSK